MPTSSTPSQNHLCVHNIHTMSDSCIKCNNAVRPRQEGIQCDSCNRWQHRVCNTGITREQYRQAVRQIANIDWMCDPCKDQNTDSNDAEVPNFLIVNSLVESESTPTAESTRMDTTSSPQQSIVIPNRVDESSLLETYPASTSAAFESPDFQILNNASTRGKDKLYDNIGYSYTKKRETKRTVIWRCSLRSSAAGVCPATVTQCGDIFTRGPKEHTHAAVSGCATAAKIARDVKSTAKDNLFKAAPTIVEEIMLEELGNQPCAALKNLNYLARNANYLRAAMRPDEPKDLNFELATYHLPPNFLRKDLVVDRRHILFATDDQLDVLKRAKRWYLDATFKVVRKPFTQLLSIHCFVKQNDSVKQVPLLYAIMSGKRQKDYKKLLKAVKKLFSAGDLALWEVVIDFEAAMWLAVKDIFPDVSIKGCVFHFTQALWRKIQQLGLSMQYENDNSMNKYLKRFMALPFLPEEKIQSTFHSLKEKANTTALCEFVDYMEKTWLDSSVWRVSEWCIFNQSVRTNNDVEGWHHRLNRRANINTQFYLLVEILHRESMLVNIQFKLVSENKLKRDQRKRYKNLQQKIFDAWDQYLNNEISTKQLLRLCAALNGPTE